MHQVDNGPTMQQISFFSDGFVGYKRKLITGAGRVPKYRVSKKTYPDSEKRERRSGVADLLSHLFIALSVLIANLCLISRYLVLQTSYLVLFVVVI